jgi:Protein of unknown function (DUF2786)
MNDTTAQVLDKIQKLLAVARNEAATPGEVEAAMNRAAHLQRLHRISDAQLGRHILRDGKGGIDIGVGAVVQKELLRAKRVNRWQAWTAGACAMAVGAKTYHTSGYERRIVLYGLPADVAVAEDLFNFAWEQGARQQKQWAKDNDVPLSSRDSKSWRDGFCTGLYAAAKRAVAEATADQTPVADTGNTMALVPVSVGAVLAATQRAVATYSRDVLHLSAGQGYQVANGSGYAEGRAAGAATSLSRSAVR